MAAGRRRPGHADRRRRWRTASSIDLGGIEVEIVALPGHSPGHLGVVHRPSGTAIVMDAVMERGLYTVDDSIVGPPPYGSVPDYRGTVQRLRELAPERLGTSHYAPIEGREAVARLPRRARTSSSTTSTRRARHAGRRAAAAGVFWERANEAVGPFPEMAVELARSVGAHLEQAVDEGVAQRHDDASVPAWSLA